MPTELMVLVALSIGCVGIDGDSATPTLARPHDPADITAACAVADRRCTQCHSLDRVLAFAPDAPNDWQLYVRRMRLTPGSAISSTDESTIVRCLQFRSFGSVATSERPR
jgi:hypothetical protein